MTPESLGRRIARLRAARGMTQQQLADRTAISRVAVSHLEMGISVPSERTVVLLAGVFHVEPPALVDGTTYPDARADRLPLVAARYTEVEHQLALLRHDLAWLARLHANPANAVIVDELRQAWRVRLSELEAATVDPDGRALLTEGRALLAATVAAANVGTLPDR